MVLPTDTTIKQEIEIYEDEPAEYDIEIKVEKGSSLLADWCIQNEDDILRPDEVKELSDVVDFEKLSEYCIQQCTVCGDVFLDSFTLLQHNLAHLELKITPITQLKCQLKDCLQHFKNKNSLPMHTLEENDEPIQDLLISRKEIKEKQEFVHKSVTNTKTNHQCKLCGRVLSCYKRWHDHFTSVHSNRVYHCMKCTASFRSARYLRRHDLYVHKKVNIVNEAKSAPLRQEVKCNLCAAVLAHKHALKTHMRNCHCEKVKCDLCETVLKKSYMTSHKRRVHYDDGKKYKCHCGKQFKSPGYLRVHIKNAHTRKS